MITPPSRVLLVEDEAIIAMTLEDMLAELGHVVTATAMSLAEGLQLAGAGGFDVALLDLNLNGQTSLPIAERLTAAGVPFAFATGYGTSELTQAYPVPLIAKPYTRAQVDQALSAALGIA